ncbi:hypothetical protein [Cellulomonas sp. NS3]|uniref:hypothetical protein n=1 Tax=Cellulomonas sp. NS3 TaxID=2973977 RepID=UPI002161D891|nr:hypothetical protein [Cellulomonas sp. NS3]
MTDDLAAALRGFAESERRLADATAPDPGRESDAIARRVGRRRAFRAASSSVAALTVLGGLAVGIHATRGPAPEPPARPLPVATATASPTTSPSTPAPTASSTPSASSATPMQTLALEEAEPMPPEMLETTDARWRLVTYIDPTYVGFEGVVAPAGYYLWSPEGRLYLVPAAPSLLGAVIRDWLPGSALVVEESMDSGETWVTDLLTGDRGPTLGDDALFARDGTSDVFSFDGWAGRPEGVNLRRSSIDGVPSSQIPAFVAQYGAEVLLPHPDRTRLLLNDSTGPRVLRTDGLASLAMPSPYPGRPAACRAWMWVGDTDVLHECAESGATDFVVGEPSEFWLVPVGQGTPRRLSGMPEAGTLGGAWRVGDRTVAGTFGVNAPEAAWWDVSNGTATRLGRGTHDDLQVVDVRGGELIATERLIELSRDTRMAALVAADPLTGQSRRVLEGPPGSGPALQVFPQTHPLAPQTVPGN